MSRRPAQGQAVAAAGAPARRRWYKATKAPSVNRRANIKLSGYNFPVGELTRTPHAAGRAPLTRTPHAAGRASGAERAGLYYITTKYQFHR